MKEDLFQARYAAAAATADDGGDGGGTVGSTVNGQGGSKRATAKAGARGNAGAVGGADDGEGAGGPPKRGMTRVSAAPRGGASTKKKGKSVATDFSIMQVSDESTVMTTAQ